MLTGKYKRNQPRPEGARLVAWGERGERMLSDENFDVVEALEAYAQEHGHSLTELSLSWLAGCPVVGSVIAGATSPEQIRANAAATSAWKMTDQERAEIGDLARVG